ncbi:MAG: MFS transporter [Chloroflexota bacterium]|nr:MFS transporter [Chloroflexota bacterium]
MRMRTAAVAFSGFIVLGLPTGMLGIAWPSMRAALDAPLAGLGVLLAAMTVTQFASSGLSGLIRERFGTTALLLVPTGLAAGGLALFALATTWPLMIAAAAILGAGLGLLDAAVNMEAALKRGVRFMGALHASWALGATLGPVLIGTVLVATGSWRLGYAVAAGAFVVLAVATYMTRAELGSAPERVDAPTATASARRTIATGAALLFVYVGIELGAGQWSFTRLTADGALTDGIAGLAVFLYWSALAAGRIGLALFGERAGATRLFDLSVGGALVSAIAFWLLPPAVAALVALPAIGISLSVFVPLLLYLTPGRVGRASAPRAIGYQVAAGMVGGAVLPAAIGVVMQSSGVGALGACLSALALVLGGLHLAARGAA